MSLANGLPTYEISEQPLVLRRESTVSPSTTLEIVNPLREGVWELRVDHGPGYRVYYAKSGQTCVLLLCGGDKRQQAADIERAIEYWQDFQRRTQGDET